jgi:RNA polymerase sigma-70 factor (ECF subfamily)
VPEYAAVERPDSDLIALVLAGDAESFEPLIRRYQPRVFATVRRYARRDSEVEDVVQEVFLKAYQKLGTFRAEAPFEHWLMRLTVRTCFDFLRAHRRSREVSFADFADEESDWLERFVSESGPAGSRTEDAMMARELVQRLMEQLTPAARLVLTLLELEDRSVKEVAALTGWSVPLVKVRAFRARAEMRKCFERMTRRNQL